MNTRQRLFDRIKMLPPQSISEEVASSVIHGIGILIAIAALVLLVVFASLYGNPTQVVSFSIFGGFAVLFYLSSTFHHSLTHYKAKRIFRIMEQSSIYLFIIGTIIPISLVVLNSNWGWTLFLITAVLGLLGILNLFFNTKNSGDVDFAVDLILLLFLTVALLISLKYFTPAFKLFFVPGAILYVLSFWIGSMNGLKNNQPYAHALSLIATTLHFFAFFSLINF
ncbi:MAG: hemolysin III family protein [Candidatus Cloacimonetes bacterium]|nr:hemolysin III family protein [Candidatus Cloacimonadota bacterium]